MTASAKALPPNDLWTQRVAYQFSRWTANLIQSWRYPLLQHVWAHVALFIAIFGICGVRAYIGLSVSQAFTHDAFMLLDGAWRMMHGQRPHIDFYSHVGVLSFAPTLVGLWIARGTAAAFGYGQALVGIALGFWSYFLCRNRLADVPAVLMSLSVTFMAAGPAALGFAPLLVEPAMTYNRCGYAVLALILVEAAAERPQNGRYSDLLGGISTGAAVGVLLFLKITYFALAVFLIVVLMAVRTRTKKRGIGIAIGFGAALIWACVYFRFNLLPMARDLMTVAGAKHFRLDWYQIDVIFQLAATLLILSTMASVLLFLANKWEAARTLGFAGLAVCIIGVIALLSNYEPSGFPLAVFLAILVANAVTVCIPNTKSSSYASQTNVLQGFILALSSVFILIFLTASALNLPYGIAAKILKAGRFEHFDSPRLASFLPVDGDEFYTPFVNHGFALLKRYAQPGETVMSLDFTNPFSFGLGIRPAPGGTTVLQYKTTFDENHGQSAQSLFGFADLVMLPNKGYFTDPTLAYSVYRIYGPYLESHFNLVAKSKDWTLYRRKMK